MARSAAASTDPFAEHLSVMKALYQEYQKHDDLETVASVDSTLADMRTYAAKQDDLAKVIIRDLSRDVRQLEADSTYPHSPDHHRRKLADLEAKIHQARSQTQQASDDTRDAHRRRQDLADRAASADTQCETLQRQTKEEESVLRRQLALYQIISKTTWLKDNGGRVAGTVSDSVTGELRPFDMDPTALSQLDLVNKLWQLI